MPTNVALTGLARDLQTRADTNNPIRIGLIGCGEMGTDVIARVAHMQGIEVAAVSDTDHTRAARALEIAFGNQEYGQNADNPSQITAVIEAGKVAISDNASLIATTPVIDVVIDATGVPEVGATIGLQAMEHGKHLIMMNVEADVCIGPFLSAQAKRLGVIYSLGAGDEPSSCMELIEFISAMGHEIICAGKGKNNPLDFDALPHHYQAEADRRNMNVRMLVEFVDGSKTMVEMCALANATGLVPDRAGMHGPSASLKELSATLIPKADGGVLSKKGCVDYSVGPGVAPGVFVIADMSHSRITERMEDLKMGQGPYFTFHRPFHLTSLEVPLTCARAVLYGKPDMVPLSKPVAEVCAIAKRNLKPGETLGAIGGYDYRAWIMSRQEAESMDAMPCGILDNGRVTRPIAKGALITRTNATPAANSKIAALRARQDAMITAL